MIITLPWPPSSLSGQNNGDWRSKASIVKKYRSDARLATIAVMKGHTIPEGDIASSVDFYPPDRRSDRLNYPNRMKPLFDGISDALMVNDKRFSIPTYFVHEPTKRPRVVVTIHTNDLINNENNTRTDSNAKAATTANASINNRLNRKGANND